MIHTDGKQTIANAPARTGSLRDPFGAKREISHAPRPTASERIRQARALREAALEDVTDQASVGWDQYVDRELAPNRGPQANGQQWNDGYCACGGAICDSPAGDKCWDCFNTDPSE